MNPPTTPTRIACHLSALAVIAVLLSARSAVAEESPAASFQPVARALLIGNNEPGAGQSRLRFAESDAKRVESVLSELGASQLASSRLLLSPSPSELWNAFEEVQGLIEEDLQNGKESVLFFYYSGHARAKAIDLGPTQIPLADLRKRIEAMPANLRVIVLDACQSGAISRVKGATVAEDFSVNSVAGLTMTGTAIMASSTGTELSQESEALAGSFFTHHFVTGLRGAADDNHDGKVSLSEVYDYAYKHTLVSTATSRVGTQHVTLETDLRGKGDLALTTPSESEAQLRLPDKLAGALTIFRADNRSVVAEIDKNPGRATTIGLPAGDYRVIVRESAKRGHRCTLSLTAQETRELVPSACTRFTPGTSGTKGEMALHSSGAPGQEIVAEGIVSSAPALAEPHYAIELKLGVRGSIDSAYTDRLETFGYERSLGLNAEVLGSIAGLRDFRKNIQLGFLLGRVDPGSYRREADGATDFSFDWTTTHASGLVRLLHRTNGRRSEGARVTMLEFYLEGVLGVSRSVSTLTETVQGMSNRQTQYGYALGAGVGTNLHILPLVGFTLSVNYLHTPSLTNELGETHNPGGRIYQFGYRAAF